MKRHNINNPARHPGLAIAGRHGRVAHMVRQPAGPEQVFSSGCSYSQAAAFYQAGGPRACLAIPGATSCGIPLARYCTSQALVETLRQ